MAKTRSRSRRRAPSVRRASAIVVAAPRRAPARRRSAPVRRVARRSAGVGGAGSVLGRALKGAMVGGVIGIAEREGHLARVPQVLQLGTIGSTALFAWAARRYGGINLPILDDVAIACATIAGNKYGREGAHITASGSESHAETAGEFDVEY